MRRVDGYTDNEQVTCIWENSTLIVKPEAFAQFVAETELPSEVPSFVPSSIKSAVVTADPVVQWFTSVWLIRSYFEVFHPNEPCDLEGEGFPDVPDVPVEDGVIN